MIIVDAQVHIWAANTPERPWPSGRVHPHRPEPFSKDDLLKEMDTAGVSRAIIVPPSWEGDRNDLGLDAARTHPDRFGVMGRLAIEHPESHALIDGWKRQPGSLIHVERIAERHPDLKIIVDHMGLAQGKKDGAAFEHLAEVIAIAKRPNVAVKASALPSYSSEPYPYRALHPYMRQVFDAFGPRRMFWGTDLTRLPCSYRQAITMFTEELPWLAASDQEWVMGRGICEWLD